MKDPQANSAKPARPNPVPAGSVRLPYVGMLASVLALIPIFAVIAAKTLFAIGGQYRQPGRSLGEWTVAFGFIFDIAAIAIASIAIAIGGADRRIGSAAVGLIVLSLLLLFA